MKKLTTLALFLAFSAAPLLIAPRAEAGERLTSRATQNFRNSIKRSNAKTSQRPVRPIDRIVLNNMVYRYEGNPTIRHEEVSSPEVMFHLENRRVLAGHAWDRQAR